MTDRKLIMPVYADRSRKALQLTGYDKISAS